MTRHDFARRGGFVYLTRWVVLRLAGRGVWVHRFRGGDAAALHTHPWPSVSLVLWGGYWEVTPRSRRWHGPGRIVYRPADRLHRIELPAGGECWTVFAHGRTVGGWWFWCPGFGRVPWRPGVGEPGGCE